jgi:coenzyme PQQ synthesis protein D (PqqD)
VSHLTIPADVVFEVLDGEAVVLNLKSGIYFTLNPVGTRMWQLIAEHGNLEKVRSVMLEEYSVEPELLEGDLENLVSGLLEKGLAQASEGGS